MNLRVVSRGEVFAAVARGRDVRLSAYVLAPGSRMVRALEAAAARGARVAVTLDGAPYFGPRPRGARDPNLAVAADLRAHGITVRASEPGEPPVHLKAAVVDGRAFLDDRNWPARGEATVLATTDPHAVAAIAAAVAGRPHPVPGLALTKGAALALEARTIAAGGDRIDLASETFGPCGVADALRDRARAGAHVRVEVDAAVLARNVGGRERAALARLIASGVAVRAVEGAEKFAVAGRDVWAGSANASPNDRGMLDWGVRTSDPRVAASLQAAFERAWARGTPVTAG